LEVSSSLLIKLLYFLTKLYDVPTGVLVAQDASGGATLVIEKCEMSDAGTFTAKGINEVGEAETSCTVSVSKPMEEPKFTSLLRYQHFIALNFDWWLK
jgi:hypothetical protein